MSKFNDAMKQGIPDLDELTETIESLLEKKRILMNNFLETEFQYKADLGLVDWEIRRYKSMLGAKVR